MAHITWKHPKPAADPFAAVVGITTRYAVHFCDARDHNNEEAEILASVIEPALAAAVAVKRPEARVNLFVFDAVYSTLTIVVTDAERTRDEYEVYKLRFQDWDRDMQAGRVADSDFDKRCDELKQRMHSLLDSVLRRAGFARIVEQLKSSGFKFWFAVADPEADWKQLVI